MSDKRTPRASVQAAWVVAVCGSFLVAVLETCLSTAFVWSLLGNLTPPSELLFAIVGRLFITHLLCWLPLTALGALILHLWCYKDPREPALAVGFIFVVGPVVGVTDLVMVHRASAVTVGAVAVASVLLAAGVFLLMRWAWHPERGGLAAKARKMAVWAICLASIGCLAAFTRSPLANPGGFRLSEHPVRSRTSVRPHVLWIVLDTIRADHLGWHGYSRDTTPFLDQWSKESIVFDNAIADGIWTVPAHASMFTGRSVREHGMDHPWYWLDDRLPTVAEVLQDHGYITAAFSNNPWIAPDFNLTRGFQSYAVLYYWRHLGKSALDRLFERLGWTPPFPWLDPDFGAALTNWLIAQWLEDEIDGHTPVMLFVNYMEAHLPYRIPRADRSVFLSDDQVRRSYQLRRRAFGELVENMDLRFNIDGPDFIPETDREVLRAQYDACIRYLDRRVEELIRLVNRHGLLNDTLVIVTSDHGEYLDTHGMWSHRFQTYNDVSHVALMVREPGRNTPLRSNVPVQLSDIFPTVISYTLRQPGNGPGVNARDLITLAASGRTTRVACTQFSGPATKTTERVRNCGEPRITHRARSQLALQDASYKFIATADGARELFDLRSDPGELHNLVDTRPEDVSSWEARHRAWLKRIPRHIPSVQVQPDVPASVLQSLKSLGYLGGNEE